MEFQYDDDGSTSIVFFLTVVLIYLSTSTFSRLTAAKKTDDDSDGAGLTSLCKEKDEKIRARKDAQKSFWSSIPWGDIIYVGAWIAFLILAYKVSQFETTEGYDPYKILGISSGADTKDIKKAYRQLSRLTHPDRNKDDPEAPDKFMRIRKAYEALTDEETRDNLEEYGNPDGRQELSFGIALPAWLVAKDNAMYVLVVYGIVFMVLLPMVIGIWWYNRNYAFSEDVLNDTKIIFWSYFKDKNVRHQVLIERLSWCAEFQQLPTHERDAEFFQKKLHNAIGELPKLDKWRFMRPKAIGLQWEIKHICCIKARYLMHAHLARVFEEQPLPPELEADLYFILRRVPVLIDSMIELFQERSRKNGIPSLQPMLAIMHLQQQFVQAFSSPKADPLLQVPWIDDRALKMLKGRKIRLGTLQDFYSVSAQAREKVLKDFNKTQLEDIEKFGALFPHLNVSYRIKVGHEEGEVTTFSFVTLVAELERQPIIMCGGSSEAEQKLLLRLEKGMGADKEETAEDKEAAALAYLQAKSKKGKTVKRKKKSTVASASGASSGAAADDEDDDNDDDDDETADKPKADTEDTTTNNEDDGDDDEDPVPNADDDVTNAAGDDGDKSSDEDDDNDDNNESDDDFDWEANDEEIRLERERQKREREQAMRAKKSHPVHCPHFPEPKQEFWWVFLADEQNGRMITAPVKVTNLVDREEVDIKFQAPPRPGTYKLQLFVVSDSYLGPDIIVQVKLDVKQGPQPEELMPAEDEIESEDSEQEFMLSDEDDEEDF